MRFLGGQCPPYWLRGNSMTLSPGAAAIVTYVITLPLAGITFMVLRHDLQELSALVYVVHAAIVWRLYRSWSK